MPSAVIVICIFACVFSGLNLVYFLHVARVRQVLAFQGDEAAAKRIILPCYRPLFRGLVVVYFCIAVALSLTFIDKGSSSAGSRGVVQYYSFTSLAIYCIAPVLLLQSSVSVAGFWNTAFTILPWWLVCNVLWGCSFAAGASQDVLLAYFLLCAALPPLVLAGCVLSKTVTSRVQLGSASNRNSVELLGAYALVFGVCYAADLGAHSEAASFAIELVVLLLSALANMLFPLALYRTLLADTKFWRGLGKHNRGGLDVGHDLRESGVEVHRPSMDLVVASSSFQDMMTDISDISVDFAYLQLEHPIGQGATSKVFRGRFKTQLVAVKVSTPPEVTQEVIDVFVAEAKIAAALKHPNIVQFVGICARPPQIAMVFEFCKGGNLKTSLQTHPAEWTPALRLRACLDAARAIACLHGRGFMHRDLKAENFFVGARHAVKLGDFGEATRLRHKESAASKRMTILGTVSFMAPELIAASKHYTQSIDVYALGVTFWEVWTGRDPYSEFSQFDIYKQVGRGARPDLPQDSPADFLALMQQAWHQEPESRPSAEEVVRRMEAVVAAFGGAQAAGSDGSAGADGTQAVGSDSVVRNPVHDSAADDRVDRGPSRQTSAVQPGGDAPRQASIELTDLRPATATTASAASDAVDLEAGTQEARGDISGRDSGSCSNSR